MTKIRMMEEFWRNRLCDAYEGDDVLDDDGDENGQLYEHFRMIADKGQQLLRIDKFLFVHLPGTSRNRIQHAAKAGFVHVNERPVKSNYRVKPGDVVTLLLNRPRYDNSIEPENIPLDIVYEDNDVIVVNKPAGMVVHPGHGNYTGTLVNAIAWHLKDNPGYDPNDPAVGLVHRIDKDTSGLLVVAKTPEAKTSLGVQFFNKTTRRRYEALVWGDPGNDEGRIEGNIARNPRNRLQMSVFAPDSGIGKSAVTHYKVLKRFDKYTFMEFQLETGRTHQIRVHMASIHHPLLGDTVYNHNKCPFKLEGQCLHAKTIGFIHPTTKEYVEFEAPIPEYMEHLLKIL